MWLVDENLPPKLYRTLEDFGIPAQSATYAGLSGITNGVLTKKAFERGFRVIVTQDKTHKTQRRTKTTPYILRCRFARGSNSGKNVS